MIPLNIIPSNNPTAARDSECVTECSECNASLERTIRVRNSDENFESETLQLCCTACEKRIQLSRSRDQMTMMTDGSHNPCKKDRIISIEDVGIGEIVSFDITAGNGTTTHFCVCVAIRQETNEIVVIKVATDEFGEKCIKEKSITMEFLRRKSAFVFRYKPLDCLTQQETVQRAQVALENGFANWAAGSDSDVNIDQQFVNWCKTDRREAIRTINTDVVQRCPKCQAKLSRSTLKMWLKKAIALECQVCCFEYQVSRTDDQRTLLTCGEFGKPLETEELNSIENIDRGDKIVYKVQSVGCVPAPPYFHPVIVTSVDKTLHLVEVVDVKRDDENKDKVDIRQRLLPFDRLKAKGAIIVRYLPLDCLPANQTAQRAHKHAHDMLDPNFKQFKNNCQHFANWCKIGTKKCEDVEKYCCLCR